MVLAVERDAYDWLFLTVTALAAMGTVGAIIVAVFGQRWHERHRSPRVELSVDPPGLGAVLDAEGWSDLMRLRLANEKGRETASDVEVFVYVQAPDEDAIFVVASEGNLDFDDPADESGGRATATIPAGFSRCVNFAVVGDLPQFDHRNRQGWAYLALYPTRMAREAVLYVGLSYDVLIVVTGSNFDALAYVGRLRFEDHEEPVTDGRGTARARSLVWSDRPASRRYNDIQDRFLLTGMRGTEWRQQHRPWPQRPPP
jgi:hypothetical protein